jgi:hypothetical protein
LLTWLSWTLHLGLPLGLLNETNMILEALNFSINFIKIQKKFNLYTKLKLLTLVPDEVLAFSYALSVYIFRFIVVSIMCLKFKLHTADCKINLPFY